MNRKVIIGVALFVVVIAGAGGGYYWWTGTPQYSLMQIKNAVQHHDKATALSYFDTDAIFNSLWGQIETKMSTEVTKASQNGGSFGTLGAMFAQGLIENLKPEIKQKFVASFDAGLMGTSTAATASTTASVDSLFSKNVTIATNGDTATVSLGNGITFRMTHTSHSHWTIVAINGLLKPSNFLPANTSSAAAISSKPGSST